MRRSAVRRTMLLVLAAHLACLLRLTAAAAQPELVLPGVVIETVDVGSAPYRSGLRSGDVLLAWARVPSMPGARAERGRFRSPFDLKPFELEEVPLGAHVLVIERAGRRLTLVNSPGPWTDMTVRSHLSGYALDEYERGLQQVGQTYPGGLPGINDALIQGRLTVTGLPATRRDFEAGLRTWELLASHLSGVGEHAAAAWLRWRIAWELVNVPAKQRKDVDPEAAIQAAVDALQPLKCSTCEADLYRRLAHEFIRTSQRRLAGPALERAIAGTQEVLPDSATLAALLQEYALNRFALEQNIEAGHGAANAIYRRAMTIRARRTPRSPERALLLGEFAGSLVPGDLEGERLCREAWRLVREVAPFTPEAMAIGDECEHYYSFHGDLAAQEAISRHAAAAAERWLPRSREVPRTLSRSAEVLTTRGKLDEAEAAARRALGQCQRIEKEWAAAGWKGGLTDSVGPLTALGNIAYARGDLATAEDWFRQAIAVIQRRSPEELGDAALGLAKVFEARGDLARATDLYTRVSNELSNWSVPAVVRLATFALERGDLVRADSEARKALSMTGPYMQNSLEHAEVLRALARIASARGDLAEASERLSTALGILRTQATGTLAESDVLQSLGELQHRRGALPEAETSLAGALAIRLRLAPGTSLEAETRHGLALLHRDRHGPRVETDFRLAIEALEQQVRRAGSGDEARAGTGARNAGIYRDYIDWLLEKNRPEDAFHVLERSRARSFLASLAERHLRFDGDTPPALAAERARAETEYDQLQALIGAANPIKDKERLSGLLARLHAVQASLDSVAERIRAGAPKVAAVRYPKPLTMPEALVALDSSTAVLSYVVGDHVTRLFVLPATGNRAVSVITIPASRDALRRDVDAVRRLIAWRRPSDGKAVIDLASTLYDALIRPAEPHIASARRLLIVGDGPLLTLPFCALVRGIEGGTPKYLVEWKPIHSALSVTSFAELRRARRPQTAAPRSVIAFGDPLYPPLKLATASSRTRSNNDGEDDQRDEQDAAARWDDWVDAGKEEQVSSDPEVLVETARGTRLTPLPATREEALAVARLFGPTSRVYLGADATEAHARTIERTARIVHFAVHGLVNDVLPLNSSLALTPPATPGAGSDNGLLQAWEIYDRLHLDADLVTLSACDTALGREARGEGFFGLTRAFLYAGARSVLASLWRIDDRSTAVLMERFYGELLSGRAKDEALRAAQLSLIASTDTAHPYYWAAFQLHGDWK